MDATIDLSSVTAAADRRKRVEVEWRAAICAARQQGGSLREIARAAGISHSRVLQIIRGE